MQVIVVSLSLTAAFITRDQKNCKINRRLVLLPLPIKTIAIYQQLFWLILLIAFFSLFLASEVLYYKNSLPEENVLVSLDVFAALLIFISLSAIVQNVSFTWTRLFRHTHRAFIAALVLVAAIIYMMSISRTPLSQHLHKIALMPNAALFLAISAIICFFAGIWTFTQRRSYLD
ncbi:hypothetical protein JW998_13590 [candidate division KSB1 bacterium]|nr:hypothetical protein [candidate division KSB1 bacterium]